MRSGSSLKNTLTFYFIISSILPLLIVAIISINLLTQSVEKEIYQKTKELSHSISNEIQIFLDTPISLLLQVRGIVEHIDKENENKNEFLKNYLSLSLEAFPFLDSIMILNDSRIVLQASPNNSDIIGNDLSQSSLFKDSQLKDSITWSSVFFSSTSGAPTVAASIPFTDGIIVGNISLEYIFGKISELKLGEKGYVVITDRNGNIISHPDHDLIYQRINISNLEIIKNAKLGNDEVSVFREEEKKFIGTVSYIGAFNWLLLIRQPFEDAYSNVNKILKTLILGVLIALALAIALTIFTLINTLKPLQDLNRISQNIAVGDYQLIPWPGSYEEINQLAENFYRMSGAIMKREKALIESEDKFRALFELSPVGMVMIGHESGESLEVNNSILKTIGYTKEEFVALSFWDRTPKKYENQELEQREELNRTGHFGPNEKEYIRKDGSQYPIKISGFLLTKTNGRKVVWEIIEDLTENKRIEEETSDLLQQLNHKSKMDAIGQLAGGMAHDFNNVLSGILSASQLLRLPQNGLNEKSLKYVDMITKSAIRASDLISKLLAFSRKGKIVTTTLDFHEILKTVVDILEGTIDKKISLSVTTDAVNHIFIGDLSTIESTFLNLGINASHAMPDGGELHLKTKNISLDQQYCDLSTFKIAPGNFLQIEIKDTGNGIPKENLNKIFEPFYTTKEQGKGTGLGLSAVYGTIQNHHGSIVVRSEVGRGTTFKILLPCTTQLIKQVEDKRPVKTGYGTILLVDDEEMNRVLNKETLESLGYDVYLAEDGVESIKVFNEKHTKIDIVLMDMIMPKMNGSEAFYKMREIDENCNVIITSGYTRDENIEKLIENGLAGFINKPYKISDISHILNDVMNK